MFTDHLRDPTAAAALKNGTGGGAPARKEDAAFPMENATDRDRGILWSTGTDPDSPLNVDYHFPGNVGVTWVAIMNRRIVGSALAQYKAQYQTGAYTPGGAFTDIAGPTWPIEVGTPSLRNSITLFSERVLRTVRFVFTGSSTAADAFAVKLWAGEAAHIVDTGLIHTPGGTETFIHPRTERATPEGTRFVFVHGRPFKRFSLPFGVVNPTLYSQLLQSIVEQRTFLYLAWDDAIYEVIIAPETEAALLMVADPSLPLRNIVVNLEEQP